MKQRGRKSSESNVVPISAAVEITPKPSAPADLLGEEIREWDEIVERMPQRWFTRENEALLVQYCKHVVIARRLSEMIDDECPGSKDFNLLRYDRLLKMQNRETTAIMQLATKMRFTQQSTIDKESKKAGVGKKKPWES